MAYAFNDGPVTYWRMGQELPKDVAAFVKTGGKVVGHNVKFEWYIWNYVMAKKYKWPELKIEQCHCTMARAYAMSLPGSLANLSIALGVGKKDMKGHALMLKMCKPRKIEDDGTIIWWDAEDLQLRQIKYCMSDVDQERKCDAHMAQLEEGERKLWLLDQKINRRGIQIDRDAIVATHAIIERVTKKLSKKMKSATNGEIEGVTKATQILDWCQAAGVDITSLKKNEIKDWLDDPDLPPDVRVVLELRTNAKASVAKLDKALDMSLVDGKVYNMFEWHGASTGRWAGRDLQVHNFARPEPQWESPEFQDWVITNITNGTLDEDYIDDMYGPTMKVIASCLRGYIIAGEGEEFIGADLKNIEGVGLAWMAGEDWKIEAFAEHYFRGGPGIYEITAARNLKRKITSISKHDRLVWGKVPELALGYGGSKGAFKSMAVNYGIKISDDEAMEIVKPWRRENPAIEAFWYDVDKAAMKAVRNPGLKVWVGTEGRKVCFRVAGEHLWLRLPSGRCLCYPFPEIKPIMKPWGEEKMSITYMGTDSRVGSKTKGKFIRLSTYGGKLVENIIQAIARDILVAGMWRVENAGYPIVLHVHDENVSRVQQGYGDVKEYEQLMSVVDPWMAGLPLAADGWRGKRYRK